MKHKPASSPHAKPAKPAWSADVIAPRAPAEPAVGSDSEGSNATQHEPNPKADPTPREVGPDGRAPRGSYPTGNV